MEVFKTAFLLTLLTLLMVFAGGVLGGQQGMLIAFVVALGMNFFAYFNSDKLALKRYNAVEVGPEEAGGLHRIVG